MPEGTPKKISTFKKFIGFFSKKERDTQNMTLRGEFLGVGKDIFFALVMALLVIQFVIQAFKIPTGSMENTLKVGDFLLGLKFVYGSPIPFTQKKLPGVLDPAPQDIVIFKFPGDAYRPDNAKDRYIKLINTLVLGELYFDKKGKSKAEYRAMLYALKPWPILEFLGKITPILPRRFRFYRPKDFIKRCVAGPGDQIEIIDKKVYLNGKKLPEGRRAINPPGKNRLIPHQFIYDFPAYRVPKKGETFQLDTLPIREWYWLRSVIYQENPTADLRTQAFLYDGENQIKKLFDINGAMYHQTGGEDFTRNYHDMDRALANVRKNFPEGAYRVKFNLTIDEKPIESYQVQRDAYFMMGDNRDNSLDSRFWGPVSKQFVKARAFIVYFSWDSFTNALGNFPVLSWPFKIRWRRLGWLIH